MFIFLDESGDLGFDFSNKKPSPFFVITLLVCENYFTTLRIKAAVKHTLRRLCRKKKVNELKSTQTAFKVKKYFYHNLTHHTSDLKISLYSVIIDKKKLKVRPDIRKLYNVLSYKVLRQIDFSKVTNHVQLFVDRSGSKEDRKMFDQYLRFNLEAQLPLHVKFDITHLISHQHAGLQAVDLFSSGIFRKYTKGDMEWYGFFKEKIVWEELLEW